MRLAVKLLVILPLAAVSLYAQEAQPTTAEQQSRAEALKKHVKDMNSQGPEKVLEFGVAAFPCKEEEAYEGVHQSCLAARKAYYDYYVAGLPRRTKVYEWNNFSTRVIFFVVLSLVAVGVYFSWKQFFGVKVKGAAGGEAPPKGSDALVTELEAGPGGIKVKSPILGVILLALSLAFFYLYLVYVYPVAEGF